MAKEFVPGISKSFTEVHAEALKLRFRVHCIIAMRNGSISFAPFFAVNPSCMLEAINVFVISKAPAQF